MIAHREERGIPNPQVPVPRERPRLNRLRSNSEVGVHRNSRRLATVWNSNSQQEDKRMNLNRNSKHNISGGKQVYFGHLKCFLTNLLLS